MRILYIDDDRDERLFLARAVNSSGEAILLDSVDSGDLALAKLGARDVVPDLLLVDIKMPGIDGFDFFEALQETKWANVPVMMFSTSGHQRDVEQAREMGAEAYAVKPLTFEELVDFVKRLYSVWARGEIGGEWPNAAGATDR